MLTRAVWQSDRAVAQGLRRLIIPLTMLLLLLACGGCGSDSQELDPGQAQGPQRPAVAPLAGLPEFPPQDAGQAFAPRSTSEDIYPMDGALYADSGGNVTTSGSNAVLISSDGEPWALYSLGGFGEDDQLAQISVEFNAVVDPEPGAGMWFAVANYVTQSWELHSGQPGTYDFIPAVSTDYVSPTGFVHIVALLSGTGQGIISSVNFSRTGAGAIPEPPTITGGSSTFYSTTLTWTPVVGAIGYIVYRTEDPGGLSLVRITLSPVLDTDYTDLAVFSDKDYYYAVAAVRQAIGEKSPIFNIKTQVEDLSAPQNLTAEAAVDQVDLSWDPVVGASGYNVYRSSKANLSNEFKINGGPVSTPNFQDLDPQPGLFNYYRVAAVRSTEGPKSSVASVFAPAVDLPAPQNLRLVVAAADQATIAWDWSGPNPGYFRVMVKEVPEFQIEPPYFHLAILTGDKREDNLSGLESGKSYFVRVCATTISNLPGRMSETLEVVADGYWTMDPPEVLGPGKPAIKLLSEEGDLTACYFNGPEVMVARRDGLNGWTTEAALTDDTEVFTTYMDIVRCPVPGGPYMVTSVMERPFDLYGAVGRPGEGWAIELIDGTDDPDVFSPENGFYCKLAATEDTWAVSHLEIIFRPTVPAEETNKLLFQTRPISGGAWTRDYTFNTTMRQPLNQSIVVDNGEFMILRRDLDSPGLFVGTSADTFASWENILATPGENGGLFNDLELLNGDWISPSCNPTSDRLELYRRTEGSWGVETVDDQSGEPDRSRVAARGNDIMIVCRLLNRSAWHLYYFDGTAMSWNSQPVFEPAGVFSQAMDLAVLDGEFYLLFDDQIVDEIHCSHLTPPPA
ncbi:hypothetical protein IT575_00655 [bacterium]|nr:hypothetical protein [bacterium]